MLISDVLSGQYVFPCRSIILRSETLLFFFLNDPRPPEISPLPLPAALPIPSGPPSRHACARASGGASSNPYEDRPAAAHRTLAAAPHQPAAVPGHGPAVHAAARPPTAPEAGAAREPVPRAGRAGGGDRGAVGGGGQGGQERGRSQRRAQLGRDPPGRRLGLGRAAPRHERSAGIRRAGAGP